MGPLGTPSGEKGLINNNSAPDVDDGPSLHDECKNNATEDELFGDTTPCEDNDTFQTHIMDIDFETQPMDLSEETQIPCLAGETQVLADFQLDEYMETQLLDESDNEFDCESEEQGARSPQLLHASKEFFRRCDETGAGKQMRTHSRHQDNKRAKEETLSPNDVVQSPGFVSKGFTAIRTASLRTSGLAAQKKISKNADNAFDYAESSRKAYNLQCLNEDDLISDREAVDLEHDKETEDENGLCARFESKVARSLAKELFMEDNVYDEGCSKNHSGEMKTFPRSSFCDNEVGGLSYVDSQEPGEASQATALEFVDRFLKINVMESVQFITDGNAIGEIVSPDSITKGPQTLAQQANRRRLCAVPSVFDWDDNHEDEGGGEFFAKKKEELLGRNCGTRRPYAESQQHGSNRRQSHGKMRSEDECQNMHKTTGLVHSDSKLAKSRKTSQLKEVNKKGDNYPDLLVDFPSSNEKVLAAVLNAEASSLLDVGIDTQMAAEAMEALSTANLLASNNGSIRDEDHENVSRKAAARNTLSKQSFFKKRSCCSKSATSKSKGTSKISVKSAEERTSFIASRTRSQNKEQELNIQIVKPKVKCRSVSMNNISSVNERESSRSLVNPDGKESLCVLERRLCKKNSRLLEMQNQKDKGDVSASVAKRTRQIKGVNCLNGTNDRSSDSRGQRQCFDVVQSGRNKRNCSIRNDADSENINARNKTLNLSSVMHCSKIGSSSCIGNPLQNASNRVNDCVTGMSNSKVYGGHDIVFQSVRRKTRSKRSIQPAEFPLDGKVLRSGVVLSSKETCQLSSEKWQANDAPAKGSRLSMALEGSPLRQKNSSTASNITPVNLKTPNTAVSPECFGDDYSTPPCKKRCLQREFYGLISSEPKYTSPYRDLRQRRDFSCIRVLFSQHLDEDIIRKQKKILSRLGVPVAPSISEASHFVADKFVRTRNMLEAIAHGKQVVTHLWLQSCGQSNCFIDEKSYILRDAKKEKELGFSMPNSLACASNHPLLEGKRVLITPNTKPSKEMVSGLVKAVHGQAVERLCRTMSKNWLPDDLLVLSSEEDFQECLPLLEKGIAVYSSELLLNGIITQQLEYDRYRIFGDYVKRTRSTLWVKKNGHRFLPVPVTK